MKKKHMWRALLATGGLLLLAGCAREITDRTAGMKDEPQAQIAIEPNPALSGNAVAPSNRDAEKQPQFLSRQGTPSDRYDTMPGSAEEKSAQGESASPQMTLASMTEREPERYLIRNATLTLEVADARQTLTRLTEAVKAMKGYVSDSHETTDGLGTRSITVTARIPYTQFDQSMRDIEGLGKVLERQVTAQDVTEEFVDTQSRVRNLKSTEARLLAHLSKTGKLSDTLLVEKELNRVREETEQLEGRLRYLANRISYSTLTLTLRETPKPQQITPPESFSSGKVLSDATRSLIGFLQGVWSALLWVGVWGILWLPPLFVLRFLARRRRTSVPPPSH